MRRLLIALCLVALPVAAATSPQTALDPQQIPQFVQPLPLLSVAPQNSSIITVAGSRPLTLRMRVPRERPATRCTAEL